MDLVTIFHFIPFLFFHYLAHHWAHMWWKQAHPIFWTRNIHNMAWFMFARHTYYKIKWMHRLLNEWQLCLPALPFTCIITYGSERRVRLDTSSAFLIFLSFFLHQFYVFFSLLLLISYVMAQMQTAKSIFNLETVSVPIHFDS